DKMLLGRASAHNGAQRNRIGTNLHQLPVNRPKVAVNTYMFDGQMAYEHSGNAPVYAPNSEGRSWADTGGQMEDGWEADGDMVRSAYTLHAEDDDFSQPRSEEHTSELQSRENLVCRLLLEKKKKKKQAEHRTPEKRDTA